jgi:hypothetical protein
MSGDADDPLVAFAHRAVHSATREIADRVAVEVVVALGAAGVDALVVKGVAIAHWLYRPGQARGYVDCDVLVAPDRLAAAGEVLTERGFTCERDQTLNPEAWTEAHEQVWRRRDGGAVELHWRLPGVAADPTLAWPVLWAHRATVPLGDAELAVLDAAGRTLHVALHAAQHGLVETKPRIDLATALEQLDEETWRAAAALASEVEAIDAFSAGLRLDPRGAELAERLGVPEPSTKWALLAAGAEEMGAERVLRWRQAGPRERMRLTWLGLFPPREQMEMFDHRARRGGAALAAAYARRLLRLPPLAVRAWRATRGHVSGDSGSA